MAWFRRSIPRAPSASRGREPLRRHSPASQSLASGWLVWVLPGLLLVGGGLWASLDSGSPDVAAPARDLQTGSRARVPAGVGRVSDAGPRAVETGWGALGMGAASRAPEPEDHSYNNIDPQSRDGRRYDPRELAALQAIIDLNGLTEDSSSTDFDDGDGTLEPLELGTQVWCGGHLREFYTGASEYVSFGYDLERLPASLGDLRRLTRLNLNSNALRELPASLGELRELRVLELYDNELESLPESMGNLVALEVLQLRGNRLRRLPASLGGLERLTSFFTADNPLESIPASLVERGGGIVAPSARVVRRNVDCVPHS